MAKRSDCYVTVGDIQRVLRYWKRDYMRVQGETEGGRQYRRGANHIIDTLIRDLRDPVKFIESVPGVFKTRSAK